MAIRNGSVKPLDNIKWCLKAAATEEMRPVLTGLNVTPTEAVATDGRRMHVVARNGHDDGLVCGLWSRNPGQQVIGKFPAWEQVWPPVERTDILDADGALPILDAAIAYGKARHAGMGMVTLPCLNGSYAALNAQYLKDVLAGREGPRVRFQALDPLKPVTVFVVGLVRTAVVMPVRQAESKADPRFDLTEFVHNDEVAEIAHRA